ncbi:hypothetical protein D3C80_2130970 [compost metagenome]
MIKKLRTDHIIILSTHILELARDMCDEIVILNNGKLSSLSDEDLNSKDFENKIINVLKENADA